MLVSRWPCAGLIFAPEKQNLDKLSYPTDLHSKNNYNLHGILGVLSASKIVSTFPISGSLWAY